MGKQVTILKVFVASPGDLSEERAALDAVIRELNQTQSDRTGVYLDLIRWETHAVPGMGTDAQAVVNESLGDEYDIFIGILSTRFGSATPRAGSGTEEEFERAYTRFNKNPEQLRIMFYFKDPVIKASEIDLGQYALVRAFQEKLGEKGLYFKFSSTEEFASLVRIHLSRQVQDWADGKWGSQNTKRVSMEEVNAKTEALSVIPPQEVEADLGLLDLVDIINETLENALGSLTRMTDAITELGQKTSDNTPKLTDAISKNDLAKSRQVLNYLAEVMEGFSQRMDAELPIFSGSFSAAIDAISRSAALWESDFKTAGADKSGIQTNHDALETLVEVMIGTFQSMSGMEQSIDALPRMTVPFNKAKRHAHDAIVNFNRELSSARNLTEEAVKELKRILERN
jgi:hypothetical protein